MWEGMYPMSVGDEKIFDLVQILCQNLLRLYKPKISLVK